MLKNVMVKNSRQLTKFFHIYLILAPDNDFCYSLKFECFIYFS